MNIEGVGKFSVTAVLTLNTLNKLKPGHLEMVIFEYRKSIAVNPVPPGEVVLVEAMLKELLELVTLDAFTNDQTLTCFTILSYMNLYTMETAIGLQALANMECTGNG